MSTTAAWNMSRAIVPSVLRHEIRPIASRHAMRALQPMWSALAAEADACPAHLTFEYCELAAARAFAAGGTVKIAMAFRHRDLLGLWPVSVTRRGLLRVAAPLTCGNGEEYGQPLVRAAAQRDVYRSLVAALMQVDADVLDIPLVHGGGPVERALESASQSWVLASIPSRWRWLPGYWISLRDFAQWDDFVKTWPKSLRATLRRRRRRLDERGHVEFGWCKTPSEAESMLIWLFDHKRRWADKRGFKTEYLADNETRDFFIALARRTDAAIAPLVAFVKVDGVPVAAALNLVGKRSVESFMTTYDESFSKYSVGNLLTEFQARWSHANGRDFDLRAYYAEYKRSWANRRTRYQRRVIVLRPRGRLFEFALLAAQAVRAKRKVVRVAASLLRSRRHSPSSECAG